MVPIGELDGWVSHEDAVTSPRANNNLGEYTACRTNSSVWMESLAAVRRISERSEGAQSRGPLLSFTRRSTRASVQQGQVFERRRPERAPSDEISLLPIGTGRPARSSQTVLPFSWRPVVSALCPFPPEFASGDRQTIDRRGQAETWSATPPTSVEPNHPEARPR
jgi:hypothetical protein